jgi:hypothetical protein
MYVTLDSSGGLSRKWLTGEQTFLDYKVPQPLFSDMVGSAASIGINNSQVLSLTLTKPPNWRVLVFRKNDSTWRKIPELFRGRAFGSFISSSEEHIKSAKMRKSAGEGEWRKEDAQMGPSIGGRLNEYGAAYPGVLHLYDAATEKSYKITTNQGDSEIILVENGIVYYRVSNRLYSAPIGDSSIGSSTLLATDDLIRDAHWAFVKR